MLPRPGVLLTWGPGMGLPRLIFHSVIGSLAQGRSLQAAAIWGLGGYLSWLRVPQACSLASPRGACSGAQCVLALTGQGHRRAFLNSLRPGLLSKPAHEEQAHPAGTGLPQAPAGSGAAAEPGSEGLTGTP